MKQFLLQMLNVKYNLKMLKKKKANNLSIKLESVWSCRQPSFNHGALRLYVFWVPCLNFHPEPKRPSANSRKHLPLVLDFPWSLSSLHSRPFTPNQLTLDFLGPCVFMSLVCLDTYTHSIPLKQSRVSCSSLISHLALSVLFLHVIPNNSTKCSPTF